VAVEVCVKMNGNLRLDLVAMVKCQMMEIKLVFIHILSTILHYTINYGPLMRRCKTVRLS
jgi:hypothetical protein